MKKLLVLVAAVVFCASLGIVSAEQKAPAPQAKQEVKKEAKKEAKKETKQQAAPKGEAKGQAAQGK
jgi:hypothetical protein